MHFGLVVSHTKSRSLFGHKSLKASVQWTTLKMHHNEVIEHHFQDQFAWVCVRLWMMNLEEKKWLIASSLEFAKKIFAGWATFEKRKKKDMKDKTWMMVRVVSGFFVWCENLFAFRLCKTLEGGRICGKEMSYYIARTILLQCEEFLGLLTFALPKLYASSLRLYLDWPTMLQKLFVP